MAPYHDRQPARKSSHKSIRRKLVRLLLILLVPTILIQVYVYNDRIQTRRAGEFQSNLEVARAVAKGFEAYVQDVLHQEFAIGSALSSVQWSDEERDGWIRKNREEHPLFLNLLWVDPQGVVLVSYLPRLVGESIGDREYFQLIVSGRDWTVSSLHQSESTGEPAFVISRAIRNTEGKLLGVVVANTMANALGNLLAIQRSNDADISILDQDGMLVYRYPVRNYRWEQRNWPAAYPVIQNVIKSKKEVIMSVIPRTSGVKRNIALAPIFTFDWVATASRSDDDTMAEIRATLLPQSLAFLVVTIVAFGTALALSRKLSDSIVKLREHALAFGKGETQNLVDTPGIAELDDLATAFNQMAEESQDRERERNRAEEKLRQSEEHFRLSFDQSPLGATLSGPDYRLKRVNEAFCRMLGYSEEELLLLKFTDLTHPDDLEKNVALQQELAEGRIDHYQIEKRYLRKDGSIIWASVSVRMVRTAHGSPIHFMTLAEDITARKRAEEELKQSERNYREIFNAVNDAIFIHDRDTGAILDVNDSMLHIYGFSYEEALRLAPDDGCLGISPYSAIEVRQWLAKATTEGPQVFEWNARNKSGELFWVEVSLKSANITGQRRILAVVRDITERKRMEKELRQARDELELRVQERTAELEKANEKLRLIPSRLIVAQEEERKRLASELHDSVGQTLAALKFRMELVDNTFRNGEAEEALRLTREFIPTIQRSIDETRAIYMGLRPKVLEDFGVIAALFWYRDGLINLNPKTHIEIEIGIDECEIPQEIVIPIFRIAQEALNNATKHSESE